MARIIVANKFFYPRGGDCIYSIDLVNLLESKGHDVAVFAMQHPQNIDSEWSKYFPSEVKFQKNLKAFDALIRPFGSKEVADKFTRLLNDFKPDIVHLNNIHSQLSPILAKLAHKRGTKVVWTLHDYKLLCPRYDCLRRGETICDACVCGVRNVLRNRCMKNSLSASLLAYAEARCWNIDKLNSFTDKFVCPSGFMKTQMLKAGVPDSKLAVINNFINSPKVNTPSTEHNGIRTLTSDKDCMGRATAEKGDYYCYVGRLSHEKGVDTLVKAASTLPYPLIVVGGGEMLENLKSMATPNIQFVGYKQWPEIKKIVGKARFSVVPSQWYENNPLSIIESLCLGTPVLGANIGGIPELLDDGINGLIFESRNIDDLRTKIGRMFSITFDYNAIAAQALQRFSADKHYDSLKTIYGI